MFTYVDASIEYDSGYYLYSFLLRDVQAGAWRYFFDAKHGGRFVEAHGILKWQPS